MTGRKIIGTFLYHVEDFMLLKCVNVRSTLPVRLPAAGPTLATVLDGLAFILITKRDTSEDAFKCIGAAVFDTEREVLIPDKNLT